LTEPVPQAKAGPTSPALWFLGELGGLGWDIGAMFQPNISRNGSALVSAMAILTSYLFSTPQLPRKSAV
jgi:hypothetical protein